MRGTSTAIRDAANNHTEFVSETLPEKLDILVGCAVLVTLMIAATCLVIVVKS